MDVSPRTVRGTFEMCAGVQVSRQALEEPFSPDERARFAGKGAVDWDTFVRLLEHLFELLGRDEDRLRELGRQAHRAPSYGFYTTLARHVGSLRHLYEAAGWSATGNFPHLDLAVHYRARADEVEIIGTVPAPYRPCLPLHLIMQGAMLELPRLVQLDSAWILTSDVRGERSVTLFGVPRERSLVGKVLRRVDAALHAPETRAVFETSRRELTLAVHRLEGAAEELRRVLDALPDPVFLLHDDTIVWANRTAGSLLGAGSHALLGRSFVSLVHPPDRPRLEPPDAEEPAPQVHFQPVRLVTSEGELVDIELSTRKTVSFEGAPATLVVARDISERMRLQQRLVMVDRLASIGTLAAGVAHEVNNPLSYILWNLDVVGRSLGPRTEQSRDGHDALGIVREGIDRVRTVVRDLRALARPDENILEPIDVHAVLETTLSLTASELSSRATVVRAYDPEVPRVHANGARLGQIFLNLILNAVASMEEQAPERARLTVSTSRVESGHLAIDVGDSGTGIGPEIAPRIFDPFFTTKPFGRGTGLGLTISQRIASDLGGELRLLETSSSGTTFRLLLPCAAP
jgi:PAS domain S-box-containing protein